MKPKFHSTKTCITLWKTANPKNCTSLLPNTTSLDRKTFNSLKWDNQMLHLSNARRSYQENRSKLTLMKNSSEQLKEIGLTLAIPRRSPKKTESHFKIISTFFKKWIWRRPLTRTHSQPMRFQTWIRTSWKPKWVKQPSNLICSKCLFLISLHLGWMSTKIKWPRSTTFRIKPAS